MSSPAHAPYNFVPVSGKVFLPEWAPFVSHDVPFKDGISGTLELELRAIQPLVIREGDGDAAFFSVGGRYCIPGSTLKGMLRSVLTIASFGKMNRAADARYSVRDLQNPELYTKRLTESVGHHVYQPRSLAGWLREDAKTGTWKIHPCAVARVEQDDLAKYHEQVAGGVWPRPWLNSKKSRPSAQEKYYSWQAAREIPFTPDPAPRPYPHRRVKLRYRKAQDLGRGSTQGVLVMTGQPSQQKHMEFLFFDEQPNAIELTQQQCKDFQFIHSEPDGRPNDEWEYWRGHLREDLGVPVFYLPGDGQRVKSFGLAQMFRLAYENSILEALETTSEDHLSDRLDLAETIFGTAADRDEGSLRGRVHVGAALAEPDAQPDSRVRTILGQPRPTFYPFYVRQKNGRVQEDGSVLVDRYATLMDDSVELAGWKRYPVRDKVTPLPPNPTNDAVNTELEPLPAGTTFKFRMTVHNLRPVELGALIWAMTWGGREGHSHSLGMGKPFGYGQVRLRLEGSTLKTGVGDDVDHEAACDAYVSRMSDLVPDWENSEPMVQLLAMADPAHAADENARPLRHPVLDHERNVNEFRDIKRDRLALPSYASFTGTSDEEMFPRKPKQQREAEKRAREKAAEERRAQAEKAEQEAKLASLSPSEQAQIWLEEQPGSAKEVADFRDKLCQHYDSVLESLPDEEAAGWKDALLADPRVKAIVKDWKKRDSKGRLKGKNVDRLKWLS